MIPISLAFSFLGALAFTAYCMHYRRYTGIEYQELEARVSRTERRLTGFEPTASAVFKYLGDDMNGLPYRLGKVELARDIKNMRAQ